MDILVMSRKVIAWFSNVEADDDPCACIDTYELGVELAEREDGEAALRALLQGFQAGKDK